MKRWTILEVLDWTRGYFEERGLENPRLDAEVILSYALDTPRVMLYARHDQPLSEAERDKIRPLVARRAKHEPVAYITGERGFWSFELEVSPATLIPRPDTETLVERALSQLPADAAGPVADVGTGTGCVALALLSERKQLELYATDISAPALAVAQKNADKLGLQDRLQLLQGDLLEPVPEDRPLALVTANLPYIPSADMAGLMPDVRDFEPQLALDGGPGGLVLIDRLIPQAAARLAPGGWLLLEAGDGQLEAVGARLREAGFVDVRLSEDGAGLLRVAEGRRPS